MQIKKKNWQRNLQCNFVIDMIVFFYLSFLTKLTFKFENSRPMFLFLKMIFLKTLEQRLQLTQRSMYKKQKQTTACHSPLEAALSSRFVSRLFRLRLADEAVNTLRAPRLTTECGPLPSHPLYPHTLEWLPTSTPPQPLEVARFQLHAWFSLFYSNYT